MSEYLLEIITPEKQFYNGMVEAVTCCTSDGELGILKGHCPMVASLEVSEIKLKINGVWKNAFLSQGFMEVRPDKVIIFSQCCEWPEEIDAVKAEEARLRALDHIRHENGIREHRHNEISLARALTRLKIKKGI